MASGNRLFWEVAMDFGFYLPMRGPIATSDGIEAMARRGEELGFA